jgi:beta-glucosidase
MNASKSLLSTSRKITLLLFTANLIVLTCSLRAQAPHDPTPAEVQKVDALVKQMTLQEKIDYIGGTGFGLRAVPRLGIPEINMSDGPYGTRSNSGFPSTTYGAGVGLAASWDRELAAKVGAGIGRDARARGVHFMLGPGINIYRSPRNGRNFEYFGEDPFLTGQIAANYITGMQTQGVSATVKHYLANNSEFLRHDSDSIVDERALREIYMPGFEAAVKQGHVSAVMDSYNFINGTHATQNGYFNIDILRKEWGFGGVLMSDWDATYDGIGAANGGLDVEEPSGKFMNQQNLLPAIKAGTVTEATIDEKVRHVLLVAASYGWLDHNQKDTTISFLDPRNMAAASDSAREGTVLLKNTGSLLPLEKSKTKTILLIGPDAYPGVPEGGGSAGVVPFHLVSALEGISDEVGSTTTVLYDRGLPTMFHLAHDTKFTTSPIPDGKPGVTLDTFPNLDLSGQPQKSEVVPSLALNGMSLASLIQNMDTLDISAFFVKPSGVSHRFTGTYTADSAGKYIVALEDSGEGNGNRVLIDDKLVFDNWKLVRAFQPAVTLDLSAGPHKVVVEEWQQSAVGSHLLLGIALESSIVNKSAVQLAAKADAVVITAGYTQESESEAGDRTFSLPYGQDELIREIAAANPKTIVAITSGGNFDSQGWIDKVPAVLESWYGGQEAGSALADILFGKVNPSGHLPATFERRAEDNPSFANYYPDGDSIHVKYNEGIYIGYRGYEKNNTQPLFPFGFGLSYTAFKFSNLKVSQQSSGDAVHAVATFDVSNTGKREGAEVAQLYVTEDAPKIDRPAHELKGFDRIVLAPGATKQVSIPLDSRSFSYYDVAQKKWTIGSSKFTISVGDSVASLPLKASLTLTGIQ